MARNITLSDEMISLVKVNANEKESFEETLERTLRMGSYQLEYRRRYNQKKNQETKLAVQYYRTHNKK